MDEQVKRIFVSSMLVIDIIAVVYVATIGNWQLGADNGYLTNLDDRVFGILPIFALIMWLKLFVDLYFLYFISRSFQESIGMLDKALADMNWFLKPGIKVGMASLILQLMLIVLDPFNFDDFEITDPFSIDFGEFFATSDVNLLFTTIGVDVLLFTTMVLIFLLTTTIGIFFLTNAEE
ncbi:MAG: hypothetical protein ACE5OZ_07540 [Candidatus Heimdallarchaeota archaeon]